MVVNKVFKILKILHESLSIFSKRKIFSEYKHKWLVIGLRRKCPPFKKNNFQSQLELTSRDTKSSYFVYRVSCFVYIDTYTKVEIIEIIETRTYMKN